VLARLASADDVAVAADGTVWIDDASRTLLHVSNNGAVLQRISDPRVPEGIVALPDGSLLLAEQGPDRVEHLQPDTQALSVVLQLTPRAGQLGVDGIGFDMASNAVVVPDSPNGTLLEVALAGGPVTRLASGMGRPVGVAMAGDGSFLVAAENGSGLLRIPARGGSAAPVPGVSQADDVVVSGRVAYVTSLSAHQVIAVDLTTLRTRVLVTGDAQPQGLAKMPDGRLVLTDSATGAVVTLRGCS
jgi:glucose/arabinose dehydrogenase